MKILSLVLFLFSLFISPLLFGIINRTKAFFAGRRGAPFLQPYFDIFKLFRKGAVYSRTATSLFIIGPLVNFSALLAAGAIFPLFGRASLVSFSGDLLLFVYLLALSRFFTILAALDTGSSFEGMGAGREIWFSALTEPVLLLAFTVLSRIFRGLSLSIIFTETAPSLDMGKGIALILTALVFFAVLLSENSRIPIDDPNTHLELTMVHEVMVLDHGGIELGLITWGASFKLLLFGHLVIGIIPWKPGGGWLSGLFSFGMLILLSVVIGTVESSMARLPMRKVSRFLSGAGAFALAALIFVLR